MQQDDNHPLHFDFHFAFHFNSAFNVAFISAFTLRFGVDLFGASYGAIADLRTLCGLWLSCARSIDGCSPSSLASSATVRRSGSSTPLNIFACWFLSDFFTAMYPRVDLTSLWPIIAAIYSGSSPIFSLSIVTLECRML